jgi:hypothetical protein
MSNRDKNRRSPFGYAPSTPAAAAQERRFVGGAYRAGVAGAARPAHATDAAGYAHEVRGDLRSSVLARPRPGRPGGERGRARQGDVRHLAGRRQPRDHGWASSAVARRAWGRNGRPPSGAPPPCGTFADYFGAEPLEPVEVVEVNSSTEPWSRGCPVAALGPATVGASAHRQESAKPRTALRAESDKMDYDK